MVRSVATNDDFKWENLHITNLLEFFHFWVMCCTFSSCKTVLFSSLGWNRMREDTIARNSARVLAWRLIRELLVFPLFRGEKEIARNVHRRCLRGDTVTHVTAYLIPCVSGSRIIGGLLTPMCRNHIIGILSTHSLYAICAKCYAGFTCERKQIVAIIRQSLEFQWRLSYSASIV